MSSSSTRIRPAVMITAVSGALCVGIALALDAALPDLHAFVEPALFGFGLGLITWGLTSQWLGRQPGAHTVGNAKTVDH